MRTDRDHACCVSMYWVHRRIRPWGGYRASAASPSVRICRDPRISSSSMSEPPVLDHSWTRSRVWSLCRALLERSAVIGDERLVHGVDGHVTAVRKDPLRSRVAEGRTDDNARMGVVAIHDGDRRISLLVSHASPLCG